MEPSKPSVIVFGGGIAGMTAAHELIERGFNVTLVERDTDWESAKCGVPCAVGGMAKSQWAWLDPSSPSGDSGALQLPPQARRAFYFDRHLQSLDAASVQELLSGLHAFGGPVEIVLTGDVRLAEQLQRLLAEHYPAATFASGPEQAPAVGQVPQAAGPGALRVQVNPGERVFPAEHGFRFFPGFYRHVFDSMQRTPLSQPSVGQPSVGQPSVGQPSAGQPSVGQPGVDGAGPYDQPVRTVYDNLVPTRESGLGLTGRSRNYALEYPRRPPRSVREVLDTLQAFMQGGGYKSQDIARFTLKLFQYMTSSNLRRREQFENISWWDFIEGESFSQPMRHDLDVAPAVLGALVARKSDARTQGSVSVQLMLDQLGHSPRTDALLNAPTTEAWFKPWREYLQYRLVKFEQGELCGFEPDVKGAQVLPQVKQGNAVRALRADYYVVATALPDLTGRAAVAGQPAQAGLAPLFIACAQQLQQALSANGVPAESLGDYADFERLAQFQVADFNVTPNSPLQHLIGIQYFFHYNDRQFTSGHSVYLDSEWRLSAISQTRFWRRPPGEMDGFDGILSVDIGDVWRRTAFVSVRVEGGKVTTHSVSSACWGSTAQDIACATLAQILAASPDNDPVPRSVCFHLDQGLHFDATGALVGNSTPYLTNRPGEWRLRPGRVQEYRVAEWDKPIGERQAEGYAPQCKQWFLCGTFMQTHTRLTTMEAANESARHAVNGILRQQARLDPNWRIDPCEIWNIEEHEPPDLRWLKELDERLYDAGHPHFIEILGMQRLPELLLPSLRHVYEPLRDLIAGAAAQR